LLPLPFPLPSRHSIIFSWRRLACRRSRHASSIWEKGFRQAQAEEGQSIRAFPEMSSRVTPMRAARLSVHLISMVATDSVMRDSCNRRATLIVPQYLFRCQAPLEEPGSP
jgi:hypothetical protein